MEHNVKPRGGHRDSQANEGQRKYLPLKGKQKQHGHTKRQPPQPPRCLLLGERGKNSLTPLLLAAYFGHDEVCELLVERGKANTEETDSIRNTALNLAAMEGHPRTVALLVSKGAKVDTKSNDGFTPLLSAVDQGHTEVCELLLEAGGDVEERYPITLDTPLSLQRRPQRPRRQTEARRLRTARRLPPTAPQSPRRRRPSCQSNTQRRQERP